MEDNYNQLIAYHYNAYRPPLHLPILKKCIDQNIKFDTGLDIGCGTGQSSIALAHFCNNVIGIEPSEEMLQKVLSHSNVSYLHFDGKHLPFDHQKFDVITFAGSLYYAKSQQMLNEVIGVSLKSTRLIVYDFEVLLDDVFHKINVTPESLNSSYNHQENFSGLNSKNLILEKSISENINFSITSINLSHLLLSSTNNYQAIAEKYGTDKLLDAVNHQLQKLFSSEFITIPVNIFYSAYKYI